MPSITSAGVGSGLDLSSIDSQLMAIELQPLDRLLVRESQYQAQISAYGQLKSDLANFQDAMDSLDSLSALKVFATSSSSENIITATASSSADVGDYSVEVTRLAEQHKITSAEALDTDTFGGGAGDSLTLQVGSDPADIITVDLTTASTLKDIRDAINSDANNPGVQATLIYGNGSNQKLVFTASESGADNAISLTGGGAIDPVTTFGFQTLNDVGGDLSLLDAEIVVDGYTINRATNNVSDVITGVTLNLVDADPGNAHTISVDQDEAAVEEAVQSFADAFNALRASMDSLRSGQLEADNSLLTMERQMMAILNTATTGGSFSYLSEIGLSIQKDGNMTLSSSDLKSALQSDFDGVAQLFAADGQGYANRMATLVDSWLDIDGLIDARTDGLEARIDDLQDRQISMERNLSIKEARYVAQFSALDSLVGQLQGTGQFLTSQLAQLPGANQS